MSELNYVWFPKLKDVEIVFQNKLARWLTTYTAQMGDFDVRFRFVECAAS